MDGQVPPPAPEWPLGADPVCIPHEKNRHGHSEAVPITVQEVQRAVTAGCLLPRHS